MSRFSYETAKENNATFLALTSLTIAEFTKLCIDFAKIWKAYTKQDEKDPKKGGRPYTLKTMEDRLFFILFYLKAYPLQEEIAYAFDISQGEANFLIHQLSNILAITLKEGRYAPPRLADDMLENVEQEDSQDYGIDGTERRIRRPCDTELQEFYYSGKAHCNTVKNLVLVGLDDRQIKGLGATHEGKKHDKKICDEEKISSPVGSNLYRDTGFQGQKMGGVNIHQPKKKPRGGKLTKEEKEENRLISRIRVVVEHVIAGIKRCRIVKDVFRNTKADYDDVVMNLACALHNFRSDNRLTSY